MAQNSDKVPNKPGEKLFIGALIGLPLVTIVTYCVGLTILLTDFMPLPAAIMLGVVCGSVVVGAMIVSEGKSLMEMGCASFFLLLAFILLWPGLMRARERRRLFDMRKHAAAVQTAQPGG